MERPSVEQLRAELERLMREQIESLARQTFLGMSPKEVRGEKNRLRHIREVSADYLEALKKSRGQPAG
jgi:hypothetical protein